MTGGAAQPSRARPPKSASRRRTPQPPHATRQQLQRDCDALRRENQRLRDQIAERERQLADRARKIADRDQKIAEQQRQIADLERQLAAHQRNSTNSSKPPSSDGLAGDAPPPRRRQKSRRRPGGQPGHPGRHRPLVPPAQVSQTEVVLPAACRHCGTALPQDPAAARTVGEPRRHQVIELPPLQPLVVEYQCPKVVCPECGETTRQPLPTEAESGSGPRLAALIAYLTVVCRMPRRVVEARLEQAFGIELSLGSVQQAWEETSQAVEAPYQELRRPLPQEAVLNGDETGWADDRVIGVVARDQEAVLNGDETGWSLNGAQRYLWALVARSFVFFLVARTRGSEVWIHLLGATFAGILCSDRWSAYLKCHQGRMQWCWAHLKRNILGIADFAKTTDAGRFCRNALALHARLFRLWHKFQGGQMDRPELLRRSIPPQKRFFSLAESHLDSPDHEVRNLATALFCHCERLFLFLEVEGVEPTNNSVERALRIAVQWRKICFGNRSGTGEVATARLLTAAGTCAIQKRDLLEHLTEAIGCHRRGEAVPSLLPKQN